ncbi:MAG: hypothetical protein AB1476_01040 [Candidatus Hadarchaeota archaeon]
MAKTDLSHIAGYLFVIGLIAAVVGGIAVGGYYGVGSNVAAWVSLGFAGLGVLIGLFMSTSKKLEEEVYVMVMISLAFLVASNMNVFGTGQIGTVINTVVGYIAVFSAAAIIILAIRTLTHFHIKKIR